MASARYMFATIILMGCVAVWYLRSPDIPSNQAERPAIQPPEEPIAARRQQAQNLAEQQVSRTPLAPPASPTSVARTVHALREDGDRRPTPLNQEVREVARSQRPMLSKEQRLRFMRLHREQAKNDELFFRQTLDLREDEMASLEQLRRRVRDSMHDAAQERSPAAFQRARDVMKETELRIQQLLGPDKYAQFKEFQEMQSKQIQEILGHGAK